MASGRQILEFVCVIFEKAFQGGRSFSFFGLKYKLKAFFV